jgi:hypothetical protein
MRVVSIGSHPVLATSHNLWTTKRQVRFQFGADFSRQKHKCDICSSSSVMRVLAPCENASLVESFSRKSYPIGNSHRFNFTRSFSSSVNYSSVKQQVIHLEWSENLCSSVRLWNHASSASRQSDSHLSFRGVAKSGRGRFQYRLFKKF